MGDGLQYARGKKLVRKEILIARSQSGETLLDNKKMLRNDDKVTFNITYYPLFKDIRKILDEMHFLLVPDEQHRNILHILPEQVSKTVTVWGIIW